MKAHSFKSPAEIAAKFGCTEERAREILVSNRAGIVQLLEKARRTGKPANYYTEAELTELVASYDRTLSTS